MTEKKEEKEGTKELSNIVSARIKNMQHEGLIEFPESYNWANSIQSAMNEIAEVKDKNGNLAINCCTKESIISSVYRMLLLGLSPAKDQCYFAVYGNKLTLMKSYFGTIAALKRFSGVVEVNAQVVWRGEPFEVGIDEWARDYVKEHKRVIEKVTGKMDDIQFAYSKIIFGDGRIRTEIMTMDQIKASWNMRQGNGLTPAHKNFPDQQAKKTVINRNGKYIVKTSNDNENIVEAFNNTDILPNDEYEVEDSEEPKEKQQASVEFEEAAEKSNKKEKPKKTAKKAPKKTTEDKKEKQLETAADKNNENEDIPF